VPIERESRPASIGFRAQYPMFSDYERLFYLLLDADELSKKVSNFDLASIRPYFSALKAIYRNFKPILVDSKTVQHCDASFDQLNIETFQIDKQLEVGRLQPESIPFDLFARLDGLHEELLTIKQFVGLGIQIKREDDPGRRVDRALGLSD
jgi:hypothetical protein